MSKGSGSRVSNHAKYRRNRQRIFMSDRALVDLLRDRLLRSEGDRILEFEEEYQNTPACARRRKLLQLHQRLDEDENGTT